MNHWWIQGLTLLGITVALLQGGTLFCKRIISGFKKPAATEADQELLNAGRMIGYFERAIIAGAVVVGSWELIAAIIALKTAARYKELDNKIPAEYFLIGSMASIAWALAWGSVLKLVVTAIPWWPKISA